jgi:hypothetical protein
MLPYLRAATLTLQLCDVIKRISRGNLSEREFLMYTKHLIVVFCLWHI